MRRHEYANPEGMGSKHFVLSALFDKVLVKLGDFAAGEKRDAAPISYTQRGWCRRWRGAEFFERRMVEYATVKAEIEALAAELETEFSRMVGVRA